MALNAGGVVVRAQLVWGTDGAKPEGKEYRELNADMRTKLVNNLLAGIHLVGAAEALALAERLGLCPTPRCLSLRNRVGKVGLAVTACSVRCKTTGSHAPT